MSDLKVRPPKELEWINGKEAGVSEGGVAGPGDAELRGGSRAAEAACAGRDGAGRVRRENVHESGGVPVLPDEIVREAAGAAAWGVRGGESAVLCAARGERRIAKRGGIPGGDCAEMGGGGEGAAGLWGELCVPADEAQDRVCWLAESKSRRGEEGKR